MNILSSALLALALAAGPSRVADPLDDPSYPLLTLPGQPPSPGARGFGPHGINPDVIPPLPQGTPSPAEPKLSATEKRAQRITELLDRLAAAKDETEASAISVMVEHLWLQSGSDTADLLMSRAIQATGSNDLKLAEQLLDKVVALRPGWVEAWNKRATVRYLADNDPGSMEDISHVLALEPRHFGALSGMGFILHRDGDDKSALTVLRKAATINPQSHEVKALIEKLIPDVEGHDL